MKKFLCFIGVLILPSAIGYICYQLHPITGAWLAKHYYDQPARVAGK